MRGVWRRGGTVVVVVMGTTGMLFLRISGGEFYLIFLLPLGVGVLFMCEVVFQIWSTRERFCGE
jgi:hypothetical protein